MSGEFCGWSQLVDDNNAISIPGTLLPQPDIGPDSVSNRFGDDFKYANPPGSSTVTAARYTFFIKTAGSWNCNIVHDAIDVSVLVIYKR